MFISFFIVISLFAQRDGGNTNAMKIWEMVNFLELSDNQSIQFFPRLSAFEQSQTKIRQTQGELMKNFREKIDDGNITKSDLETILEKIESLEKEYIENRIIFVQNSSDILTIEQQARLVLFEHYYKKKLKNIVRQKNKKEKDKRGFQFRSN